MLERDELVPGLVLFLDPLILLGNHATFNGPSFAATRGSHYFVCEDVSGNRSVWVPTSSKPGWDRARIRAKAGRPEWVGTPTYALEGHRWSVDMTGLRLAARADRTCRGTRNYALLDFLASDRVAA